MQQGGSTACLIAAKADPVGMEYAEIMAECLPWWDIKLGVAAKARVVEIHFHSESDRFVGVVR